MKTKHTFGFALLGGISLFLALQGCNDDGDANPTPPVIGDGGSESSGGSSGSGGKNGGGNTSTAGVGDDGGTGNTNVGGDAQAPVGGEGGGPVQPECDLPELGEDGCFNCPENGVVEQWLNRCVESDCVPFNNDRVTLLEADGSLPDLP